MALFVRTMIPKCRFLLGQQDSISQVITEAELGNQIVVLNVRRDGGTIGQVRVAWQVTGDHAEGEIEPSSGEVS